MGLRRRRSTGELWRARSLLAGQTVLEFIVDAHRRGLAENLWMTILASLGASLLNLYLDAVRLCPGVVPDSCYLPRNATMRISAADLEPIVVNLFGYIE
jgi:hypothetical protein